MKHPSRGVFLALAVACAAGTAGARPAAAGAETPRGALPDAVVSQVVGIPVRLIPQSVRSRGENMICTYEGTGSYQGVFVSLHILSGIAGPEVMGQVKAGARAFLGQGAEPEAIQVGQGGYAYGSASHSMAAAMAKGRVYSVAVSSLNLKGVGNKKAEAIALLKKLIE